MVAYMPTVKCAKCNKLASVKRVHNPKGNRRYVEASCHGETQQLGFASSPDVVVTLWQSQPALSGSS